MRRKLHRTAGIIMLLPFIAWAATAVFFLVRPAYEQAYERLMIRHYPIETIPAITPSGDDWQETRYLRTALGDHLLVRTSAGWQHLHPDTHQVFEFPDPASLSTLLKDAFSNNPTRYGELTEVNGNQATTSTGVNIRVDWNSMHISQEGRDTRWINQVYDIHYLRWTGIRWFDQIFGLFGLFLLMFMTYSGARMAFGSPRRRPARETNR